MPYQLEMFRVTIIAQVLAAGTRPDDAFQRRGGLHGPVDVPSVGLRCISETAAAVLPPSNINIYLRIKFGVLGRTIAPVIRG